MVRSTGQQCRPSRWFELDALACDAGCDDQYDQEEAGGVDADVAFAACNLLARPPRAYHGEKRGFLLVTGAAVTTFP